MKKTIYIWTLLMAFVAVSCSPGVDLREQPEMLPQINVEVNSQDANQPVLTITDKTVFEAKWDFGNGVVYQGTSVKGFFPLKGTYAYTVTAANGAGISTKTGSVNVPADNLDLVYNIEQFSNLVGTKEQNGKIWVWDQNKPGGDVCYMTSNTDWTEFWWNPYAGDDGGSLPGITNEIKFDLDGGFNYTRYEKPGVIAEKGFFNLNVNDMTITLTSAHIPNFDDPNLNPAVTATGKYHIKVLSPTQIVLWQDQGAKPYEYGWAWKFKAKAEEN